MSTGGRMNEEINEQRRQSVTSAIPEGSAPETPQARPAGGGRRKSWIGGVHFQSEHQESDHEEEDHDQIKHTFIDAEMMKDKVRKSLMKPENKRPDFYKEYGVAQFLAKSPMFENLTLCIITFNAVWIAHDTDSNQAEILLEAEPKFQLAEHFFCTFFCSELFIRWCAFAQKRNCLKDAWFVFDSLLVLMMVLETWFMTILLLILGARGGGFGDASVIRIARLLRLSRMARMARLLRVVPELMILIKGMVAAIRSVCFTIMLLVIIMYVFAISLTQLTADTKVQRVYFTSVPATMYALMMHGCLLDGPKELSDALGRESPLLPPIFWLFVLMAALTVMNMLVGVLCEVVSAVAATEKEENLVNFVKGKVLKIVANIDKDGDMQISQDEFKQILGDQGACRALQDVGVDVVGLIDLADTIFQDEQGKQREQLDFPDFMELVLQLRGTNQATVKDIVQLRKMITNLSICFNNYIKKGGAPKGKDPLVVSKSVSEPAIGAVSRKEEQQTMFEWEENVRVNCKQPLGDMQMPAMLQGSWDCPGMEVPMPSLLNAAASNLPGLLDQAGGGAFPGYDCVKKSVPSCPPPIPHFSVLGAGLSRTNGTSVPRGGARNEEHAATNGRHPRAGGVRIGFGEELQEVARLSSLLMTQLEQLQETCLYEQESALLRPFGGICNGVGRREPTAVADHNAALHRRQGDPQRPKRASSEDRQERGMRTNPSLSQRYGFASPESILLT